MKRSHKFLLIGLVAIVPALATTMARAEEMTSEDLVRPAQAPAGETDEAISRAASI